MQGTSRAIVGAADLNVRHTRSMKHPGKGDDTPSKIRVHVPITVREVAPLFRVKPFRIVSELAKSTGYAEMSTVLDEARVRRLASAYRLEVEIVSRPSSGRTN